ncbi:alpha/beta fold hydrolase [Thermodesulfobacteriota bacterium]
MVTFRTGESSPQTYWESRAATKSIKGHRDTQISYQMIGDKGPAIMLASGLGGRLYIWEPLLETFSGSHRLITWDYRGIFESDAPRRVRRLAVGNHAEDACRVMEAEGISRAVFIGWSMGVQVSLEFSSLYPDRVDKLVLINGTHGHAFSTGLQPLFRIPWLQKILHEGIDWLLPRKDLQNLLASLGTSTLNREIIGGGYARLRRQPRIKALYSQYMEDIFGTDFGNYLRLFQELDAHSVYHLLRNINHETLIISGLLDFLTPAYQSREMCRKLPNSRHICIAGGTHFVLVEYPDEVAERIAEFLSRKPEDNHDV